MNIRITLKWWYWLAAVLPLGAWLSGWTAGLPIAFAAVGAQIIHFAARTLSLAPWNRTEPLSWRVIKQTYLTPPVRGSFLERSQSSRAIASLPLRRAS